MKKEVGFVGLGNMGKNMVLHLLEKGYVVHAWNRSPEPREEVKKAGAKVYGSIPELIAALPAPKVIWSMVSAGEATDLIIEQATTDADPKRALGKGDIIIDGVNSFYKDTLLRAGMLEEKGISLIDCGVSGGIEAARNGACIMAGGDTAAFAQIEPLVADLAAEGGYGYFGKSGSGHYVKMVHNAIEYGIMQALGEGMNLLNKSPFSNVDLVKLTEVWNHASIISGNLIKFLNAALQKDPKLDNSPAVIGSLGTGKWAVQEALDLEVPLPVIAASVLERYASRGNSAFTGKVISALRTEFGGHSENERDVK